VVGFLEVCDHRLQDVLLAGKYGMLTPEMLQHVMYVSASVQRALDAEREGIRHFDL